MVNGTLHTLAGWADRAALRGFGFFLVFFALIEAFVLGASALGWQCDRGLLAVVLVASVLTSLFFAGQLEPSRLEHRRDAGFVWFLASLSMTGWAVQLIRVAKLAWERPVYDWDGLYYHVPAIHGWVEVGRVTWLDDLVDLPFANGYPMGVEVLAFVTHTLTQQSRWVDAPTLFLWPLGVFALVILARQMGASPAWAWFTAGLSAQIPVFVALSSTTYVDAAFAIACWCALAASLRWFGLQSRASWTDAILLGAALGLCVGIKGLGWVFVTVLAVFLLWNWFRSRVTAPRTASHMLLALLVMTAVGGYWPLRNIAHTGNPIYPIEVRIGEKLLVEGYDPHRMVTQDLPEEWRVWPAPLRPLKSWVSFDSHRLGHNAVGGMGVVWIALGFPSILWLAFARSRAPRWPRWMVVFLLMLLVAQPGNWWSRFTLWMHGIGLPAAALASSIFGGSTWRRSCHVALLGVFVLGVIEANGAFRWEQRQGRDVATGEYMATLDYYFPNLTGQDFAADFLAADRIARSPWGRMGTLMGGGLSLPLGRRHITVLDPKLAVPDLERLRSEGVDWVVWDVTKNRPVSPEVRAAVLETFHYQAEPAIDFEFLRL